MEIIPCARIDKKNLHHKFSFEFEFDYQVHCMVLVGVCGHFFFLPFVSVLKLN